jgi:hypothetical protein
MQPFWVKSAVFGALLAFSGCHKAPADDTIEPYKKRKEVACLKHSKDLVSVQPAIALRALVAMLHDEGYVIDNYSEELGFLTAVKQQPDEAIFDQKADFSTLELSAQVQPQDGGSIIKINFIGKSFDGAGLVTSLVPMDEEGVYEAFFSRLIGRISLPKPAKEPGS